MRRFWWLVNCVAGFFARFAQALHDYAWSRYWYGVNGVGTETHPHLASVTPKTWREAWDEADW